VQYDFSDRLKDLSGNAIREIFKLVNKPDMISFAGGLPATQCLPVQLINEFADQILKSDKAYSILQYGETEGYMPLRLAIIDYVKRVGINNIDLSNILIVSGGQQGIDLSFKAFINKGDYLLVENPTYLAALHIARMYQANIIGVDSPDDDGIDINDLEYKIKKYKPKVFYIVSNFSNPTGKTLSLEKRKQIAHITAKYNVITVEDDPYRELRYSGEHLPSIKSFDEAGNIIYVSSFSKLISPSIRVGIAIADKNVIAKLTIGKQGTDVHTVTLSQAIAEKFLTGNYLLPHIEKSIPVYREKRDLMISCIKQYMPPFFKHTMPQGGLFIWGEFTNGASAVKNFYKAVENKVAYVSGCDFFADGTGANCIRLNFSNASSENIIKGIQTLAAVFNGDIK
jgi:2-aminoadipate transaminase